MPHDDIYSVASLKSLATFFVNGVETVIVLLFTIVLGRPVCSTCISVA